MLSDGRCVFVEGSTALFGVPATVEELRRDYSSANMHFWLVAGITAKRKQLDGVSVWAYSVLKQDRCL